MSIMLLLETATQYLVQIWHRQKKFKKKDNDERLNNWKGKIMHRQIEDKDKSNTWKWLRKNDLKGGD